MKGKIYHFFYLFLSAFITNVCDTCSRKKYMFLRGQHMPKDTQMFLKDEKAYEKAYEKDHFFL